MPKTHFLVSSEPQKFDQSIQALCGAVLANPQPVVMVEVIDRGMPHFGLRDCSHCISAALDLALNVPRKTYVYGIIEGEEAMHSGETIKNIEDVVTKHSRSLEITDSASGGESEKISTETR